MTTSHQSKVHHWLAEPMPKDVAQSTSQLIEADDVAHVAIMPDVHLAKEVCVGVAMATRSTIYPAAVGSDIGCGMAAIRFEGSADFLTDELSAARLLGALYKQVPTMRHSAATMPAELPESLQSSPLSCPALERLKSRDGRVQLGTLGRGNHFLEFQRDAENALWLMVHSGSRGMGQAISSHYLRIAETKRLGNRLFAFEADSEAGKSYLADAAWAESYAAFNRLAIINAVTAVLLLQGDLVAVNDSLIHANHNHVRRETHFGTELWVHRKGALPAQKDAAGVIPGSMGTRSFHVSGRGCEQSLCSSSHGAGRALSRGDAMKSISPKQFTREMGHVWFDHRQISKLRDEAPSAYKDIHAVMRAQSELTRIVRELRPVLCYKGI